MISLSKRNSRSLIPLNSAKMAKYSEVMTPTPCTVAGCIISIRPTYSWASAHTYLFTYTVGSGRIKPARLSPKSEIPKIERSKVTIKGPYKVVHGLLLAQKCMTLNDLWARFKVIDSLNAAKMAKCSLVMTPTRCRISLWLDRHIFIRTTYSCARALTYLAYLQNSDWHVT